MSQTDSAAAREQAAKAHDYEMGEHKLAEHVNATQEIEIASMQIVMQHARALFASIHSIQKTQAAIRENGGTPALAHDFALLERALRDCLTEWGQRPERIP